MPEREQLTVSLPLSVSRVIREKVASGEYESESEVICDGILHLEEPGAELSDEWLREEALPALQALEADPSRARTAGQVMARLNTRHKSSMEAG